MLRQRLDGTEQPRGPGMLLLQVHGALPAVPEDGNVSPYFVRTSGTRVHYAVGGKGRGELQRVKRDKGHGGHGCEVC